MLLCRPNAGRRRECLRSKTCRQENKNKAKAAIAAHFLHDRLRLSGAGYRNFPSEIQCTFFHVWLAKSKYYYRIQCYRPAYIKSCDPVPLLTVLSLTDPVVVGVIVGEVCQLARQLLGFGEREAA